MKVRYAVPIEDVYDVRRGISFLEEMYPDVFKLYEKMNLFLEYCDVDDKQFRVLDLKIRSRLRECNLPHTIIFEGEEEMSMVVEFLSKGEVYLPLSLLEKYRITPYAEKKSSYYFDRYENDDIMQIYNDFSLFCQNNDKNKISVIRKKK